VLGPVARARAVTLDAIAIDVTLAAFRTTAGGAVAVEITSTAAATAATATTPTSSASGALAAAFAKRPGGFAAHDPDGCRCIGRTRYRRRASGRSCHCGRWIRSRRRCGFICTRRTILTRGLAVPAFAWSAFTRPP